MFRLCTVFVTVCIFITVAITVHVHYVFLLPFAFSLPLQLPCACIMRLHILFTLSPAAVAENTPLQVVTISRAGSVELRLEAGGHDVGLRREACLPNSPLVAARPRSVGLWAGEASYSRSSLSQRLTA